MGPEALVAVLFAPIFVMMVYDFHQKTQYAIQLQRYIENMKMGQNAKIDITTVLDVW